MASPAHTTRRSLFAIAAGAALLPSLPAMAHGDDAGQFESWLRQSKAAWDNANLPNGTEAHTRRWCLKAHELDTLIVETPARSREAVIIKLETMERMATENLDDGYVVGLAQVRAFLLNGDLN